MDSRFFNKPFFAKLINIEGITKTLKWLGKPFFLVNQIENLETIIIRLYSKV